MKQETLFVVPSFESETISVRVKVYSRVDCGVGEDFYTKTRVFNTETKQSALLSINGVISKKTNSIHHDVRTKQAKLLISYDITPNKETIEEFNKIIKDFENERNTEKED